MNASSSFCRDIHRSWLDKRCVVSANWPTDQPKVGNVEGAVNVDLKEKCKVKGSLLFSFFKDESRVVENKAIYMTVAELAGGAWQPVHFIWSFVLASLPLPYVFRLLLLIFIFRCCLHSAFLFLLHSQFRLILFLDHFFSEISFLFRIVPPFLLSFPFLLSLANFRWFSPIFSIFSRVLVSDW